MNHVGVFGQPPSLTASSRMSAIRLARLGKKLVVRLSKFQDHGSNRRVILCYHSVGPKGDFSTPTGRFNEHLQWLSGHCHVIPLADMIQGRNLPTGRPCVAITFDDGYQDNHEYVLPLLLKHGISATFFLTVGLIEKSPEVIARFTGLRRTSYESIRPLEWCQVREMQAHGMSFGAHTYSHCCLAQVNRDVAREEMRRSKMILEDRLGTSVPGMAYPFGKPRRHFTEETVQIVAEVGYSYALAVCSRAVRNSDSPLQLPRILASRESLQELEEKVSGAWDIVGLWHEKGPLWAARIVSPSDFINVGNIAGACSNGPGAS